MGKTKQVIVIRKDLNMRKGKIAAQAAHASVKVLLDNMKHDDPLHWTAVQWERLALDYHKLEPWADWLDGSFTKICVFVNSETELDEIYNKAVTADMPCALIVDSGATEFHGVATKTCCAIGPDWNEEVDKITGKLPLL